MIGSMGNCFVLIKLHTLMTYDETTLDNVIPDVSNLHIPEHRRLRFHIMEYAVNKNPYDENMIHLVVLKCNSDVNYEFLL